MHPTAAIVTAPHNIDSRGDVGEVGMLVLAEFAVPEEARPPHGARVGGNMSMVTS